VQVDPMKPTLKAPRPKRPKLQCNILLSTFAFKFNLRRYNKVVAVLSELAMKYSAASSKTSRYGGVGLPYQTQVETAWNYTLKTEL